MLSIFRLWRRADYDKIIAKRRSGRGITLNRDIDKERFELARQKVFNGGVTRAGIGTLGEKTLHAVVKRYMEPYDGSHEVKIGSYVADIVGENGIVEIQTRGFDRLRGKLADFLEVAVVTVVYPIARTKWLVWIDPETGETTQKRKSPKRGTAFEAFFELYRIKPLLNHPNLRILLLLVDIEEYRNLNGWSENRKRGSSRYERIPLELAGEVFIENTGDYAKLIPNGLPNQFTSKDYAKASGLSLDGAQTALNVLGHVGAVRKTGKQGRLNLYEINIINE